MATQLQIRRGTTAQMNAFTGAEGELAVNTTTDTVHVHDGSTAGGFALAKADGSNIGTYAGSFTTISASGAITATGIDVTGTATMDAATVQTTGSTTAVLTLNNADGNGTLSQINLGYTGDPDHGNIKYTGAMSFQTGGNTERLRITSAGQTQVIGYNAMTLGFPAVAGGASRSGIKPTITGAGAGQLEFLVGGDNNTEATTVAAMMDSSGNVGIGTSSPNSYSSQTTLTINGSTYGRLDLESAGTLRASLFATAGSTTFSAATDLLTFDTSGGEAMRIDASGRVGIGTSSPSTKLEVLDANGIGLRFGDVAAAPSSQTAGFIGISTSAFSGNNGDLVLYPRTSAASNILLMGGNVGIGTSSPSSALHVDASSTSTLVTIHNTNGSSSDCRGLDVETSTTGTTVQRWFNAGSELGRFTATGNLLVGTTDAAVWDNTTGNGINLRGDLGLIASARTNAEPAMFNRMGTDGEVIKINKDGALVGSISSRTGSSLIISSAGNSAGFHFGGAEVNPVKNGALSDNTIDLGQASYRYDDIYATNGTIQTSDFNEKQDIAELSDAEQRVAVACKGLLRKFRWKDAVAEKGDDARTHFGIIAQDLQAAFAAESLDAGDYAMFISSTWTDEETNEEKTRMGVRYSELLAFIIAAI